MNDSLLEQRINKSDETKRVFAQEELILDIAEAIWAEMEKRNWSKKQLAEALDRTPAYVTQLLNGGRNMTLRTLADVAHALKLKTQFRFCNENNFDHNWSSNGQVYLTKSLRSTHAPITANENWQTLDGVAA